MSYSGGNTLHSRPLPRLDSNKTTTHERQHTRIARRGPCASSPRRAHGSSTNRSCPRVTYCCGMDPRKASLSRNPHNFSQSSLPATSVSPRTELAAQVYFAPGALAGARGVEAAPHLAPAGPPGVGGPGDASAVRWGGLGGRNDGERPSRTWQTVTFESWYPRCNDDTSTTGEPNA